ncbi:hypothetical protein GMMP15_660039 [Candidatus Magnetomoraceae bacterium gMMP-15]
MHRIKKINCYKCKYYYVTWDKRFPHGCRAMKFKSNALPYIEVRKYSGMPCQVFEPKIQKQQQPIQKNGSFFQKA